MKTIRKFLSKFFLLFIPLIFFSFCKLLVLNAQTPELWGVTSEGGEYGGGTIFKTDRYGENHEVKYSFVIVDAKAPTYTKLCDGSNGKLYGVTADGGAYDLGVLFAYDTISGSYTKLLNFDGSDKGRDPHGHLIKALNGNLYGLTASGGITNNGVLFEYDPVTDTYTKKLEFDGILKGSRPNGSLLQASNGKFYGMTFAGGTSAKGVLFEYDLINDTYTKLLDFDGTSNGANPYGSLIEASDGKLYGMTNKGGTSDYGVLFSFDLTGGVYTKILDFNGASNGQYPFGSLIQASDGKIYGMTANGGNLGAGTLFEYDLIIETYTKLLDFDSSSKGYYPNGTLMEASDDKLYGMTLMGGSSGNGILFEYDTGTGIQSKVLDFDGTIKGSNPKGSLIQISEGKFYGMTSAGGTSDLGVLFDYDPVSSIYTKKIDFGESLNGKISYSTLLLSSDDKLYGMSHEGGMYNSGVIFEYDPGSENYTKLVDFEGSSNGADPYGSLMEASDGLLYGMTYAGGTNSIGVLFVYDPVNHVYTKKLDFDGASNGRYPNGDLIQAVNGKLYGTTVQGGSSGMGVLFEYDHVNDLYNKLHDFDGVETGTYPQGCLFQAEDGKLYGMTQNGGTFDYGVIFVYDFTSGTVTKLLDFDGTSNGRNPAGGFIQAIDGKFYGVTLAGGVSNKGVLFTYDPNTDVYNKILDFTGTTNGYFPSGTLNEASNEKIYGTTYKGGESDLGVIFEYDPVSNIYTKKLDLNGINGKYPRYGKLMERNPCYNTSSNFPVISCDSYTVPSGNETYYISGVYNDTIPNICGSDSIMTIDLTVGESYDLSESIIICYGSDYTFPDGTIQTNIISQTVYTSNLFSIYACDSIIETTLNIETENPQITSTHNDQAIDADINCEANLPDYTTDVTATDNCDADPDVTQHPTAGTIISGATNLITITVSDDAGNITEVNFNVSVEDNSAPLPDLANLDDLNGECSVTVSSSPTATDNCEGSITATTTDPLSYDEQGTYTIIWEYDDGNGNVSGQEQIVIVEDLTDPEIVCIENQVINLSEGETEYTVQGNEFDPVLTDDNCELESVINDYTDTETLNGASFGVGTETVIWTVTDIGENTGNCSFEITILEYVSIENVNESRILIHPNPTNEIIHLFTPEGKGKIEFYDITGKFLISEKITSKKQTLDISSYNKGLYIILIRTDENVYFEKIIKE